MTDNKKQSRRSRLGGKAAPSQSNSQAKPAENNGKPDAPTDDEGRPLIDVNLGNFVPTLITMQSNAIGQRDQIMKNQVAIAGKIDRQTAILEQILAALTKE